MAGGQDAARSCRSGSLKSLGSVTYDVYTMAVDRYWRDPALAAMTGATSTVAGGSATLTDVIVDLTYVTLPLNRMILARFGANPRP